MRIYSTEQVAELQRLTDEGGTAKEIASEASRLFGFSITRNQICGMWARGRLRRTADQEARRTGSPLFRFSEKPKAMARRARRGTAPRTAASVPPIAAPVLRAEPLPEIDDLMIPAEQRKTLLDLTAHTCRWPVGNPGEPDFFYCGAEPLAGLPYCAAHYRRSISLREPTGKPIWDKRRRKLKFSAGADVGKLLEAAE